ncbi:MULTISPECIES: hypothetical protein [unclassified Streptomyces]|uniref:hypothetical protein n=1 Tax=unclassified Streptomyces TaxID=2593676 RepID=UPI0038071EEC
MTLLRLLPQGPTAPETALRMLAAHATQEPKKQTSRAAPAPGSCPAQERLCG